MLTPTVKLLQDLESEGVPPDLLRDIRGHAKGSEVELLRRVLETGLISEDRLYSMWAKALGVAFLHVDLKGLDDDSIRLLPKDLAVRHDAIVVSAESSEITVAMVDPQDVDAVDAIRSRLHAHVVTVLACPSKIRQAIELYYKTSAGIEEALGELDLDAISRLALDDPEEFQRIAGENGVIRIVEQVLLDAIRERASDVHIEPREDKVVVRYRIDGELEDFFSLPRAIADALVSRVKILADLDIAERRRPLDGSLVMSLPGGEPAEFRISTVPTVRGEKVVARLLESSATAKSLEALGLPDGMLRHVRRLNRSPHGMLIVTGPTGSGKSTTLYSLLQELSSTERNILTCEDPVEIRLPLANQVSVAPQLGRTFATVLRSFLRQDPDVIMIGEIRDQETASIAVQAALTGHLVLATLHTNTAVGAIPRLIDLGVEPFLLAPALLGVLGQRLVRAVCPRCRVRADVDPTLLGALGIAEEAASQGLTFYRGEGCRACRHRGFSGRIGLFELVEVGEVIQRLIARNEPEDRIRSVARAQGYRPLVLDGLRKCLLGQTTPEELARVASER
ncbi:MAG: GspE/PulE family protein [Planctomycetota bacterium]